MRVKKSVSFSESEVSLIRRAALIVEAEKVLGPCGAGEVYTFDELYRGVTVSIEKKEM